MKQLKTDVTEVCLGPDKGRYICFIHISGCTLSYSGVKSAKRNSSLFRAYGLDSTFLLKVNRRVWHFRLMVSWPTDKSIFPATLSSLSLSLLVHVFTYYTLSRQLNVFCVWCLFIQCNAVCNAMRPCTGVPRRYSSRQSQLILSAFTVDSFVYFHNAVS